MMKKWICLLLTLGLCCSLVACGNQEQVQSPVDYYYPRTNYTSGSTDSILASEVREAAGHEDDLDYLIKQYLKGPVSPLLRSPFPSGTKLIRMEQNGDTLTIILDSTFAQLTGLDLTIACASLSKTCMALSGATTVQISADGPTLDGERSIIISADSLVLMDEPPAVTTSPTTEETQ
jgi:ABC-type oligopeptide transport system substrate-binding subunit